MKNKKSCLFTVLFFAIFIGAFTVFDFIKPAENFSEFENRYLTGKPKITWASLMDNSYTQSYEKYINDQFVLRNNWINLKSKAEALLLKIENNGIVYGKENMLFEKYSSVDYEQLDKNIGFLKEFSYGKNLSLMIIPSAYELYKENLPYGLSMVDQKKEIEKIYENLDGVKSIDLFGALEENKNDYIYYRTDHHWTTDGAYLGYKKFCEEKSLTPQNPQELKSVEDFLGTYFNKCKNSSVKPDTLKYLDINLKTTVNGEEKENYLDYSMLDGRDKYAAFLHGNSGLTVLSSGEKREKEKILVIKDSFANCFVPFLTYNYNEVYVVDLRSMPKGVTELVENNDFDDILIMYNFKNFESDTNFYRLKY